MILTVIPTSIGGNSSSRGIFTNGSFESGTTGWTYSEYDTFGYGSGGTDTSWKTHGSYSYHLYIKPNSVTYIGEYFRIEQKVDLTGINAVVMDIKTGRLYLDYPSSSSWEYNYQVRIYIDKDIVWNTNNPKGSCPDEYKEFLGVVVDVSGYSGTHSFAFEMYETQKGTNMFGYTFEAWIDNIREVMPADVTVKPANLHFNSNAKYLNVRITDFPANPECSPVDIDGSTVKVEGFGTIVKFDKNVDSKYMGKVDRQIIMDAIGSPGDQIEIGVSGQLNDGTAFYGTCMVKAS
jgi:hypothetical protein